MTFLSFFPIPYYWGEVYFFLLLETPVSSGASELMNVVEFCPWPLFWSSAVAAAFVMCLVLLYAIAKVDDATDAAAVRRPSRKRCPCHAYIGSVHLQKQRQNPQQRHQVPSQLWRRPVNVLRFP